MKSVNTTLHLYALLGVIALLLPWQQPSFKLKHNQKSEIIIRSIIRCWVGLLYEPQHEISNNVVCATSKGSDQPAHKRSLIRAFASRLNFLLLFSY